MPIAASLRVAFTAACLFSPALTTLAADAPARQVITHEALWMMKRVGSPAVSPDGKWVVFSVLEPAYDQDKEVNGLWLTAADGSGTPRRLTHSKARETGVTWSPDSHAIAFSGKREGDEVEQIYVLDLAGGGDARRVTTLATGAASPQWRADGRALLFESFVWPGASDDEANKKVIAERKARKYNVRVYEHFPIRYWNQWFDERHPTIMVQSLEEGAQAHDVLAGTQLARTPGFAGEYSETSMTLAPLWSPDGSEILFTATTERWNAAFAEVAYHLYRMGASAGVEPRVVTPAGGEYRDAAFAPDGHWLYFKYAPQDAEVYHLNRLQRVPWPQGGEASLVTRDLDRDVGSYAFTPDSRTVYLIVPEAANDNLYRVDAAGGTPEPVIVSAVGGYGGLVSAAKAPRPVLIAQWGSSVSPWEIVRIDAGARRHTNLTHIDSAAAAAIDWAVPEHFYFTSAKGRSIHSMIVRPPAFDPAKKYPLLVLIHGGAASNNPDQIGLRWNYHLLAAPGYVILLTDYTGSTGFGEKFAQAIKLDPLKTPGDEINEAVDEALKRFAFIDATRMCAAGASYGGHLANWLEATTTRYRCLISHAGEVDLTTQWGESDFAFGREVHNGGPPWGGSPIWREQSPITYGGNWKTPMLLSIGERDYRVPIGNTLENWTTLQRMQVPSRLLVWPDAWHWILKPEDSRYFYKEVHAWLATYLKDSAVATPPPAR
jgi:dipeptidyl aminopeptidase/acylaminoacyl peptidase